MINFSMVATQGLLLVLSLIGVAGLIWAVLQFRENERLVRLLLRPLKESFQGYVLIDVMREKEKVAHLPAGLKIEDLLDYLERLKPSITFKTFLNHKRMASVDLKIRSRLYRIKFVKIMGNRWLWLLALAESSIEVVQQKYDLLNEVVEGSPIGIVSVNADGTIYAHNQMFLSLLNKGFKSANLSSIDHSLKGQKLISLLNSENSADSMTKLTQFFAGQEIEGPLEIYFNKDQHTAMNVYLSSIEHTQKVSTLYFVDISEHKKLSLQLSQSQKMQAIGQLAGGIAHDFNNLLTAMIGYCDLLLLRHSPSDLSFNDIMQIKQNANRAANLVRQLLAFSRQQTLQPKVIDVTENLAELSILLQRLIGPAIALRVIHARDLWLVKVDQGQLEQVIINLAVNARDAMPEGGKLNITTSNNTVQKPIGLGTETVPVGEYVVIKVSDTGMGIAPENLTRVFDPFFSTKAIGAGTGLGLSTVYGIVNQTGGYVSVESQLKKGTTFTIYLPKYADAEAFKSAEVVENTAMMADLSGTANILLVEDEDSVRLFSARALKDKGYVVYDVSNGPDALKIIDEKPIDLVITDVVMAPMDGPTLAKHILEKHPRVKIIFISGYAEDSFRSQIKENTNAHFLSKPFNLKDLARKVKDVLER
jgi:two-component system cell cycle sensor histidine kinase/response regulator CckA